MAKISVNNLAQAIYESLKDKDGLSFDATLKNTVSLIRDKHMIGKMEEILKSIQNIIDKEDGVVRVKINTKSKIEDKEILEIEEIIKKKYKVKEVVLDKKENPKLLGGIKIEIGDEVIDMTLINKLHQLQNYLITN